MRELSEIAKEFYKQGRRIVAPLMGFPGVGLIGSNIKLAQQNWGEHYKVIKALVDLFSPDIVFPLMDLSVEANALGRYTIFPREDSATVPKDRFNIEEIEKLSNINLSFDSRVIGYVETLKLIGIGLPSNVIRGAYVTGPYTLSGLMMGADEAAIASVIKKDELHKLCNLSTSKILEYIRLLISAGAEIICVLEPMAVMLSPQQFFEFSASFVKQIAVTCKYNGVNTVYHTCGNTMHLIERMVESEINGISLDSKDAGVILTEVAKRVPENVIIVGNINPATTMLFGEPEDIKREVTELMDSMRQYPNFVLSTGCDLPQETPIENIRTFMDAGRRWKK